jgi:hypothetical protein
VLGERYAPTRVSVRIYDPRDDSLEVRGVWSAFPTEITPGVRIPARGTSFFQLEASRSTIVERAEESPEPATLLDQLIRGEGSRAWVLVPLERRRRVAGVLAICVGEAERLTDHEADLFERLRTGIQGRLLALADR